MFRTIHSTSTLLPTTVLALSVLCSGCASIVSRSSWPVVINSSPSGANIRIVDRKGADVYKGTTPATVDLKSGNAFFSRARYEVHFTMAGYGEHVEPIEYRINGWYWGNILLGGVIGMLIVDPATGAMYKVKTPTVIGILSPGTSSIGTPRFEVLDIRSLDAAALAQLERIH